MNNLRTKHAKFVEHYLKTGNGAQSAKIAGYSEKNAAQRASILLKSPQIQLALKEARAGSIVASSYSLDVAMKETDDCIEFARATKNANAMIKAIELKTKLNGLLIEKHEVKQAGFIINITGIDDIPKLQEAKRPDFTAIEGDDDSI